MLVVFGEICSILLPKGSYLKVFNKFPYRNRAALYSAGDFVSR